VSATAFAAAFVHKPGTAVWLDPSGQKTTTATDLAVTAAYYGLEAIKVIQYDKVPCGLEAGQASFAAPRLSWLDKRAKACEPTVGQAWKQADLGAGHYTTGIAVCTKDDENASIRGVELWGNEVGDKGVEEKSTSVKLEFSDCKKWQEKRSCAAGSVATAIRAFSTGKQGFVGLALRCQELEPRGR
jgi:hypothetical protein